MIRLNSITYNNRKYVIECYLRRNVKIVKQCSTYNAVSDNIIYTILESIFN